MPAQLNEDVLLGIIDELSEYSDNARGLSSRNGALARVCLASRALCSLAQPRLWQHIEVSKNGHVLALKRSAAVKNLGRRTRTYAARWSWTANAALNEVVDMSSSLPAVADLQIHGSWRQLDLTLVARYASLRHLLLVCVGLASTAPCTLPHLERLSMYNVSAPSSLPAEWLRPHHLPSLRALRLIGFNEVDSPERFKLDQVLAADLLAQLDFVQTCWSNLDPDSVLARGMSPPILFELSDQPQPLPRHSLLLSGGLGYASRRLECAREIVEASLRKPDDGGDPFVIVFPQFLQVTPSTHPAIAAGVREYKAMCWRYGGWVIDAGGAPSDPHEAASLEFWQWARARKAAQAAAGRQDGTSS
ncbi:hypothetical protein JCM9279_005847 [Rhodotorula babjevae]